MSGFPLGQRIADPRVLSDELGGDSDSDMYSSLASYTFGSPSHQDQAETVSPLTLYPDRTPRPSVSVAVPPFSSVSSHPSQVASSPNPRRHSSREPLLATSGLDAENSQDPTPSTDPIIAALYRSQRGKVMPDDASQHTFGRASRSHGVTAAAASRDGATPSSSTASVTTSRSSSRASMHTLEQFSSDDELEIDCYDGSYSPVTFARDYLPGIDEDVDLVDPVPSIFRSFDGRRGSLPMAIPGAPHTADPFAARSREGSILTLRRTSRTSRSWDDSSTNHSSHSVEDPTIILPKSEPVSRAGRISLEDQQQARQAVEPNVFDGIDLGYILSKRSEGSIRSFGSRLSFVQSGGAVPRRSSPHLSAIPVGLGSTTTLPFLDSFTNHLQKNDRTFDATRYYWSFQREKADASSSSSRRRQQAHHRRTDKSAVPSRVQEMWRCGHVGRFKVDRLVFKPQSADPSKAAQHRIQIRHIPDPYASSTVVGPHSVIHKHSRAIAFSIFRSHGLFSGSRQAGGTGAPTHMNTRSGTMLALKKVQEQYTSTKTTRSLGPFQSGDKKSVDAKEEGKGKSKSKSSSKSRSRRRRLNQTESANSSTATSSAGSVTNSAIQQMASAPEHPVMRVPLSHSPSSSSIVYKPDSVNRPVSSASLLSSLITDSVKAPESEVSSVVPVRHHREHRDSIDSVDHLPTRTTHAEAFSTLDPNDIESLRAKAHSRANTDSTSAWERVISRIFRGSSKADDHSVSSTQSRAFQPPWLTTAGRDQQEENDRVLDDLNASFRDVGLLHTNPHKSQRTVPRRKSREGVLDQIPDDCLYMLLPLWPGESDTTSASVNSETSSTVSFSLSIENRQFLLVYYVPFEEASPQDKKNDKKKAKHTHSADSGIEPDAKTYLHAFRVVARVVTYDELQLSNIRIPSNGLAVNGPGWEAMNYSASSSLRGSEMTDTVVCQCHSRERGFDFLEDGLLKLGLCTREECSADDLSESEEDEREGKTMLTPIGRAAVEMIWLGCLAITSFTPT